MTDARSHMSTSSCCQSQSAIISTRRRSASRSHRPRETQGRFAAGAAYTGGRSHDNSAQVERESHGNSENKAGRRNKRSVWSVSTNGFRGAHFAVFPEKLIEPCILAGCPEGGVVLDPFAGSGTTGVVAKRMGRGFMGCEINPSYVEMAARRIAEVE